MGQAEESLSWLERAIASDGEARMWARTSPDLSFLLEHPQYGLRFRALVGGAA